MDNESSWKSKQDVLDDFDLLCDFYDPKLVEKNKRWQELPRGSRNRGNKVVSSDESESDNENTSTLVDGLNVYVPKDDLQELDPEKELEVQNQLRSAVGVGYSNDVIESHWRKQLNGAGSVEEGEDETPTATSNSPIRRRTTYTYKPAILDEELSNISLNDNRISENTTESTDRNLDDEDDSSDKVSNSVINQYSSACIKNSTTVDVFPPPGVGYYDYDYSSDENVVIDCQDIDRSSLNTEKGAISKKKSKTKFIPIPAEDVVNIKCMRLNPLAPEFFQRQSYVRNSDYKLKSKNEFPPL